MNQDIRKMFKDAAILLVITVAAGLVLGFVYQITKEPIALAEENAAKEAYKEVFPEAEAFSDALECATEDLAEHDPAWKEYAGVSIDSARWAQNGAGEVLGYVLTVTSHEGYGGDITFTMGIKTDGTLNGISILSISETAGLGMRAEEVLKPQFANKNVSKYSYTKSGDGTEGQIDAISGATITTRAFTNAVNAGLYFFQTELGGNAE